MAISLVAADPVSRVAMGPALLSAGESWRCVLDHRSLASPFIFRNGRLMAAIESEPATDAPCRAGSVALWSRFFSASFS